MVKFGLQVIGLSLMVISWFVARRYAVKKRKSDATSFAILVCMIVGLVLIVLIVLLDKIGWYPD